MFGLRQAPSKAITTDAVGGRDGGYKQNAVDTSGSLESSEILTKESPSQASMEHDTREVAGELTNYFDPLPPECRSEVIARPLDLSIESQTRVHTVFFLRPKSSGYAMRIFGV